MGIGLIKALIRRATADIDLGSIDPGSPGGVDIDIATETVGILPGSRVSGDIGGLEATYNCAASIAVNDIVFASSDNTVAKASASSNSTVPAIGVVTNKPTTTTCDVRWEGIVGGFSGLTASNVVFLGLTAGTTTQNAPSGANEILQVLGTAKSTTEIHFSVDRTTIELT